MSYLNIEDDLIYISTDADDKNGVYIRRDFYEPNKFMYDFIRHRGLEQDFIEYVKRRQFIEDNKQGIADKIWQVRRNSELKSLFERLKKGNPDMVDDLIRVIHYRLEND